MCLLLPDIEQKVVQIKPPPMLHSFRGQRTTYADDVKKQTEINIINLFLTRELVSCTSVTLLQYRYCTGSTAEVYLMKMERQAATFQ